MRINRSSSKKVSTRRAHRPDQATYRTMRRRINVLDRGKLFWIEITLIILFIAVVVGVAKWLFFS